MKSDLEGKRIKGYNESHKIVEGIVHLVYVDALASGTNEYVGMTYLSIMDDEGKVHEIKPRNVIEVINTGAGLSRFLFAFFFLLIGFILGTILELMHHK